MQMPCTMYVVACDLTFSNANSILFLSRGKLPFSRSEHDLLSKRAPIIDTNYYCLCQVIAIASTHECTFTWAYEYAN